MAEVPTTIAFVSLTGSCLSRRCLGSGRNLIHHRPTHISSKGPSNDHYETYGPAFCFTCQQSRVCSVQDAMFEIIPRNKPSVC